MGVEVETIGVNSCFMRSGWERNSRNWFVVRGQFRIEGFVCFEIVLKRTGGLQERAWRDEFNRRGEMRRSYRRKSFHAGWGRSEEGWKV